MRNQDSLTGAFALLERVADNYSADCAEGGDGVPDGEIHELLHPSRVRALGHRRMVRPTVIVAAAAVVAALAVAVSVLVGSSTPTHPAVGPTNPPAPTGQPTRSLPFALTSRSGVQILAVVGLDPTDTTVTLAAGANEWQLNLYAPGSKFTIRFATGVRPATVDRRPGYIGPSSSIRAVLASASSTPQSSSSLRTPPSGSSPTARQSVAWRFEPSGWALLQPQGPISGGMSTLEVARSLNFHAISAMRSEFALRQAPVGMHLLDWISTYQAAVPAIVGGFARGTEADYGPSGSGNRLDILVAATARSAGHREAVTVNGRAGYWYATSDSISIKFGTHEFLIVGGLAGTGNVPGTMSEAQLIAIAATIAVTSTPSRPKHWFDARTALP